MENRKPLHQVSHLTRCHFRLKLFNAINLPTIEWLEKVKVDCLIWSGHSDQKMWGGLEGERGEEEEGGLEESMMAANPELC